MGQLIDHNVWLFVCMSINRRRKKRKIARFLSWRMAGRLTDYLLFCSQNHFRTKCICVFVLWSRLGIIDVCVCVVSSNWLLLLTKYIHQFPLPYILHEQNEYCSIETANVRKTTVNVIHHGLCIARTHTHTLTCTHRTVRSILAVCNIHITIHIILNRNMTWINKQWIEA